MSILERLKAWHETQPGLIVFGLAESGLAYAVALRAINTGTLLEYFVVIVLTIGGVQNITKCTWRVVHNG